MTLFSLLSYIAAGQKLESSYSAAGGRNVTAVAHSRHTSLFFVTVEKPQGPLGNWLSQLNGSQRGGGGKRETKTH